MNTASLGLSKFGRLLITRGVVRPTLTVAANYTASMGDDTILVNSASKTVTLPSAVLAGNGARYTVKALNVTGTVVASAAGTIDGGATDTTSVATAYSKATYVSNGTVWFTI